MNKCTVFNQKIKSKIKHNDFLWAVASQQEDPWFESWSD